MNELKPCPFCGGEARPIGGGGKHFIGCDSTRIARFTAHYTPQGLCIAN